MSSSKNTDSLLSEIMARLNGQDSDKNKNNTQNNNDKKSCLLNLTPEQVLIIAGVLSGVLEVYYVLVNREQQVQILLQGDLKPPEKTKKTELECMLDQIGSKSFDEVVKTLMNRLS